MTPALRKLVLTAHITFSVGWIGAVASFLALAIAGSMHQDAQMARVVYPAMELTARFVIVPLAFAALLTGLIQSLSTPWGLFRHYWVLVKLLLTLVATVVLLVKIPLISYAARQAAAAALSSAALLAAGRGLLDHSAGGLLVLLVITTLSVYKPWGLTRYGQRMLQEWSNVPQQLDKAAPVPLGLKILFAVIGVLVVVLVSMHVAGHGLHHGR